jgi:hypothetical protein
MVRSMVLVWGLFVISLGSSLSLAQNAAPQTTSPQLKSPGTTFNPFASKFCAEVAPPGCPCGLTTNKKVCGEVNGQATGFCDTNEGVIPLPPRCPVDPDH